MTTQIFPTDLRAIAQKRPHKTDWFAAGALFAITLGLYARTAGFDFLDYDDQVYVFGNPHITTGLTLENARYAMTAIVNGNWHPLTTFAWLVLASLPGASAGTFHLTNALLHAVNASLFFWFLVKSTGRRWPAIFASALWAVHPQRVESVAWVSELKDTLSGALWLGCLLAYRWYSLRRNFGRYGLVAVFFVLAILAKPIAVTTPLLLLLLDYWPLCTKDSTRSCWTRRVLEKLPMLMVSIAAVAIGIHCQYAAHANISPVDFPLPMRLKNALVSYIAYLQCSLYPKDLSVFYPHPAMVSGSTISTSRAAMAACALIAISAAICMLAKSYRYLLTGWFWFLGTLVPVIGIVQAGYQARADRFTYLPAMGLAICVAWLVADVAAKWQKARLAATMTGAVILLAMAWASNSYISCWRNGPALFAHVLEVEPDNYLALAYNAHHLKIAENNERSKEALALQQRVVEIAPKYNVGREEYAVSLRDAGQYSESMDQLKIVVDRDPWDAGAWDCEGTVRQLQAEQARADHAADKAADFTRRAINDFRQALLVSPDFESAAEHLALELASQGQLNEAIKIWQSTTEKDPGYGQAQGDLADALLLKGDQTGAVRHYRQAIADGEKNPQWESKLAYFMATNPSASAAQIASILTIARDACEETNNQDAGALDAYAACLARLGQFDDAVSTAKQAVTAANAAHQSNVSREIAAHLELYEQQQPFVVASPRERP